MERFGAAIGRYFTQHDQPWTITHQDFRLDNMLFDTRDGNLPVAVVDWQTFLRGPAPLDACYFNGAGLLVNLRRQREEQLAKCYHQNLLDRGVKGYDWNRRWHDYRLHTVHGLIMGIVGAAVTEPIERGAQMLSPLINRHAIQAMDPDTLSLIETG